jgi:two-component system, NtrC family, sensor kinase
VRRLGLRLAVSLAAVTLIGLSLLDVAFVVWTREQVRRERAVALRAAAADGAARIAGNRDPWKDLLEIAARHGVVLTAVDMTGTPLSTGEVTLPPSDADAWVSGGWEHWTERVDDPHWSRVVASFALESVAVRVLEVQRAALPMLAAAGIAMVGFGLLFLRRSVLGPIARMTDGVAATDDGAFERLGSDAGSDDLARLGRAIVSMRHRIAADREHIAAQLVSLEATQSQLVRAERLAVVGQLAAGLAHEVGNPLTVVAGYVGLLYEQMQRDGKLGGKDVQEALARMRRELDRIQGTVRALLDFGRAPQTSSGRGDVAEAFDHVRRLLGPQDRLRGVELAIEAPAEPLDVPITTDALTQVLVNLVFNAADAVRERPTKRIVVRAVSAQGRALLTVDDSGPGIPADVLPRIFEPFFTTKPAGQGTGLGLSVCERIVTSAGGELSAGTSHLGGARFTISVPRSPAR